jgi:hypothetical protein
MDPHGRERVSVQDGCDEFLIDHGFGALALKLNPRG